MSRSSFLQQLLALLHRNILYKVRNRQSTIQEILSPILSVSFVMLILLSVSRTRVYRPHTIDEFPTYKIPASLLADAVYVSPNVKEALEIARSALSLLHSSYAIELVQFATAEDAERVYVKKGFNSHNHSIVGIHFETLPSSGSVSYRLRFGSHMIAATDRLFGSGDCDGSNDDLKSSDDPDLCEASRYFNSDFLSLQVALDSVLAQTPSDIVSFPMPEISVELMPKELMHIDRRVLASFFMVAFLFVSGYSCFVQFLTMTLVVEKEIHLKDYMRMMGMRDAVYWLAWIIVYTIFVAFVSLAISFICWIMGVMTSPALLFLLIFLYGLSMIALAFLVTPFFSKAELAGNVVSCSTLLFSLMTMAVMKTQVGLSHDGPISSIPAGGQWILSLLSPVALTLGMNQALFLNGFKEEGLTYSNAAVGQFSVYAALAMLAIDSALYMCLAVIFQGLFHRGSCVLWFNRIRSLLTRKRGSAYHRSLSHNGRTVDTERLAMNSETVPPELEDKNVVKLRNVTKVFDLNRPPAVNDLSLDIYEGQITALIGHNGAGKTTLMNILTGLVAPTEGSATIYGHDVTNAADLEQIRSMTGVCLQHNVLLDELTCYEHLVLFGRCKGVPQSMLNSEVARCLADIDLADSAGTFAKCLSGGQKRKLSLAIALIGNSRVLILDEPTSGLDPISRRAIWSLLKQMRPGRVILLSTHFMDEADILADRKAIISHGQLKCVGSSFFLKIHFGIGYHLSLTIANGSPAFCTLALTELVTKHVPGAVVQRVQGQEVIYTLPLMDSDKFPALFQSLEQYVDQQRPLVTNAVIGNVGISMTTLEEVFTRIELDNPYSEEMENTARPQHSLRVHDEQQAAMGTESIELLEIHSTPSELPTEIHTVINETACSTSPSRSRQVLALIAVRFFSERRSLSIWFGRLILPIAFFVFGAFINRATVLGGGRTRVMEPLALDAGLYCYNVSDENSWDKPPIAVLGDDHFARYLVSRGLRVDDLSADDSLSAVAPHYIAFKDISTHQNVSRAATVLYNDSAIHSLPIAVHIATASIFHGFDNQTDAIIDVRVSSWPWPELRKFDAVKQTMAVLMMTMWIGFMMILIAPSFAAAIVRDKQWKCRRQLRLSGVSVGVYWFSQVVVDLAQFAVPVIACLVFFVAFGVQSLLYAGAILSLSSLLMLSAVDLLLLTYVLTFAFRKFQTARAIIPMLYLLMGLVLFLVQIALQTIAGSRNPWWLIVLNYGFLIASSPYCIFVGITAVGMVYVVKAASLGGDISTIEIGIGEYIRWQNGVIVVLLATLLHIIGYCVMLYYLELRSNGLRSRKRSRGQPVATGWAEELGTGTPVDVDVLAEKLRVEQLDSGIDSDLPPAPILVRDLVKEYMQLGAGLCQSCRLGSASHSTRKIAVSGVSFAVDRGEIFGLLGPNSAGKTSTLNAIISETSATSGKIKIGGHLVESRMSEGLELVGLCAQEDPLWPLLTLEEHLQCYAKLRGVRKDKIEILMDGLIKSMQVSEHRKKYAMNLSGGTKRKLAFMLSLIGSPSVVLLDEPSTGMDPVSRRRLWDAVRAVFVGSDRCCVLTTHHMEEADIVCSRLAIMVNGKLECIGSTQHLKKRHGGGYVIELELAAALDIDRNDQTLDPIQEIIRGTECMEHFGTHRVYRLPPGSVDRFSDIFAALEHLKRQCVISEYSFSQSTLEQVFLQLARHQTEDIDSTLDRLPLLS